jgi:SSS family solute:Na+ symporter
VARALVHAGYLPDTIHATDAFYVAAELVSRPGIFGLVLAALTAALMSTVDTLITAVAAVTVNDVYKLYIKPDAGERTMLSVARWTSVIVTMVGVALVPLFMQFDSIYSAHGAFTAAVTPPLVVTLLLSVFWRRFTKVAALATLLGGLFAVGLSLVFPELVTPFAQGVSAGEPGSGLLAGMKQYKFMRACFGLCVSATIGVVVSLFTKPESAERQEGLVWGRVPQALANLRAHTERRAPALATVIERVDDTLAPGDELLPMVRLSSRLAEALDAGAGDRVYVSDTRWWLGGLYAAHGMVEAVDESLEGAALAMGPSMRDSVVAARREGRNVKVEKE